MRYGEITAAPALRRRRVAALYADGSLRLERTPFSLENRGPTVHTVSNSQMTIHNGKVKTLPK